MAAFSFFENKKQIYKNKKQNDLKKNAIYGIITKVSFAFVAQRIEHLTSDQRAVGSSPTERANLN